MVIFRRRDAHTGGETYLTEVHKYLAGQGVNVIPIWLDDLPLWPRRLGLFADCVISNLWFLLQVWRLPGISRCVLLEDFHLHPRIWLLNHALRARRDKPLIPVLMQSSLMYHDSLRNPLARALDKWIIQQFFRQASVVLCNSHFSRDEVLAAGVPPEKTDVVYCGYHGAISTFFTERPRRSDKKRHLLFVGQCAPVKGLEYLLQALALIDERDVILDVVGNTEADPEYFFRLTRMVSDLGVRDGVVFHGHVSDRARLSSLYRQTDVFVLPSLVEGFGIVILEAMSSGLPVVATKVGAIPELVVDGKNGILVPPKNPQAMAAAIARLLSSPRLSREYGQEGLKLAEQRKGLYSWEAVGERIMRVLEPEIASGEQP
ncbi:MAG: glycosyltransferase family 4 protein [Candidatus Marsarchaeota archaeon]|nr:glycosyltransferase family 4 protein [Candidatus Marsarchaeota archaeon]